MDYSDHDRFIEKIELTETGCWRWTACIHNKNGYGQFGLDGKVLGAHQASWRLFMGEIPKGLELDHSCHNVWCVNVNHLRLATDKEQCANRRPKQVCRNGHRYDEVDFHMRVTTDRNGKRYEYRICKAYFEAYKAIANERRRAGRIKDQPA